MSSHPRQNLHIYQSLWAMELRRPDGFERTMEENFAMVADAGYHGMAIDLGVTALEDARALRPQFERHNLGCMINAFPTTIEGLRPVLRMARDFDAAFVNVIGQVMPLAVEDMVPVIEQWMEMADAEGMPIQFETHRNCITNDLFATLLLLERLPGMPLCADLSHYLVDREFWFPISPEDDALIERVLARADSFQGRVASREQIQVQISFPQHTKWFDQFATWWARGFRHWRARKRAGETCIFLCELGPTEYAITGPDGYELSDRWEEALMIRARVEEIWRGLEAEDAAA
ncbi:MAG: sugar phosphate isomerase/epimerase [Pseudomonadota bacterium]